MALELTLAKAQELVEQVIQEKGADTVYEKDEATHSCLYVHRTEEYFEDTGRYELTDVQPGCLVGQALLAGGLEFSDFDNVNSLDSTAALNELEGNGKLTFTQDASRYLEIVQLNQDQGKNWGEAEAKAREGLVWTVRNPYGTEPVGGYITYDEYFGH